MTKKLVKVILVMLMVFGMIIAVSNMVEVELKANEGKLVRYYPEIPDCKDKGNTCVDFTGGTIGPHPNPN